MKKSRLLVAAIALAASAVSAADRPNILILYADDLGFGDLGCYNPDSQIPTPQLDKLATRSIRFTDGLRQL